MTPVALGIPLDHAAPRSWRYDERCHCGSRRHLVVRMGMVERSRATLHRLPFRIVRVRRERQAA